MDKKISIEFTNYELTDLHNALNVALIYSQKSLSTWKEIVKSNSPAMECVKVTECEIASYSDLIKKIESNRGF